jgi:DNA invertase Pin-like site-specific DNA recombinase
VELSLSAQEHELRERAKKDGFEVFSVFADAAESGRLFDRPAFSQMLAQAKQKPPPFTRIYTWDIFRFGRADRIQSATIKQLLRMSGIEIIYHCENLEDNLAGRLVEAVIEAVGEYQSLKTAEDTRRGHRDLTAWGYHHGGAPPYGYRVRRVEDGGKERSGLEPNPEEASRVRWMFAGVLAGASPGSIARELNDQGVRAPRGGPWNRETVAGILRNPIYVGRLEYGRTSKILIAGKRRKKHLPPDTWKTNEDPAFRRWETEGIVDAETFAKVSVRTARKPRGGCQREKRIYILAGAATCEKCGGAMVGTSTTRGKKSYYYYYCNRSKSSGDCTNTSWIPAEPLENAVISYLRKMFSKMTIKKLVKSYIQHTNPDRVKRQKAADVVKKDLRKIENQVANLLDAVADGIRKDIIKPRLESLDDRKSALLEELKALEREKILDAAILEDGLMNAFQDMSAALNSAEENPEALNSLIRMFCKMTVDGKKGKILIEGYLPKEAKDSYNIDFPLRGVRINPGRSGRT